MKKLKTLLYGLFAAAMITGCSDDTLNTNDPANTPGNGNEEAFLQLDIQMPDGLTGISRSSTTNDGGSTGGVEIGLETENKVSSALIVLASKDNIGTEMPEFGFIAASEVRSNRIANLSSGNTKQYRATAGIQREYLSDLYALYNDNGLLAADATEGPEVYVFVFCNPTSELLDLFDSTGDMFGKADWIDETCTVIQDNPSVPNRNIGIWGANSFLMNNVSLVTRALPAKLNDWDNYNSVEKPFHLSDKNELRENTPGVDNSASNNAVARGSIRVERSVARFDFRDGSGNDKEPNTYNALYHTDEKGVTDKTLPLVKVHLEKMCLVNMSNKFYYLPRVSSNGLSTGDKYKLLGSEVPWVRNEDGRYSGGNYLVGPYAVDFNKGVGTDFTNYFNYSFFENDGNFNSSEATWERWYVSNIKDVLENGHDDNYEGTAEGGTYKPGDYKIWRYVTENLIPAPRSSQQNGISTGVVFKARILGTEEALNPETEVVEAAWNKGFIKNIAECLNGGTFTYQGKTVTTGLTGSSKEDPIFYYFNGHLYMGWRHIRQAAIQAAVSFPDGYDKKPVINRSNSLYKAVFGDGPIPASNRYMTPDNVPVAINDPRLWNTDTPNWEESEEYLNYKASADYAWMEWMGSRAEESIDPNDPLNVPELLANMRKAVSGAGITIYESSVDDGVPGYYCYYYYWNRHNDNGIAGQMGPMEFDVVRNNVYKLSVDKINRLGHPRIPDNDPNSPTPDTPDESDEVYLDVRVTIVPWAVRINTINF